MPNPDSGKQSQVPQGIPYPAQYATGRASPTLKLGQVLALGRCPHCRIDRPHLGSVYTHTAHVPGEDRTRYWAVYLCSRCAGFVCAESDSAGGAVVAHFPEMQGVDDTIPSPANEYLRQAMDSIHAPAGCVMLSASAIDAMLKAKDYTQGTLYQRIDKAEGDHLITPDMARWAHDVRLDANDQRHADPALPLPTTKDAQRAVEFAKALAQFMFVLPARVQRALGAD